MNAKKILLATVPVFMALLASCSADIEDALVVKPKGERAYAEVTIGEVPVVATRATTNTYDHWSIATFGTGDVVGMYSTSGRQNPEDLDDFTLSVQNEQMFYEGRNGNSYRFGNSDIVLDPPKVTGTGYSIMYYPYFKDMPDPDVYTPDINIKGLELRVPDKDDQGNVIEKCLDFMYTSSSRITLTEGVMKPSFKHHATNIVVQRGNGFNRPEDSRVFFVMKQPYTDIRITRTQYTNGVGEYKYTLQYNPEEGEEVMGKIYDNQPSFDVNKYCVWEAWDGELYKSIESKYVMLPPTEVSFIMIQDNYGDWHNVTDFYLSGQGSKTGTSGYRYVLNISLEGVDVVVRPVSVEKWDEETSITDDRKVGINNFAEYNDWVMTYNSYVSEGRKSGDMEERLRNFGDAMQDESGRLSWKFYINSDIDFADRGDYPKISSLEDLLEGSSTYTNYVISNVKGDLIDKMSSSGVLHALDFKGLYVIQPETEDGFFGGLVNEMNDGLIDNCNIINGVVVGNGAVGMLAGTITGGTINNCSISGDVIGLKSYPVQMGDKYVDGLFGTINGTPVLTNVRTSGLKFIEK